MRFSTSICSVVRFELRGMDSPSGCSPLPRGTLPPLTEENRRVTVAVVTGASGALGQAVVSALCERGDHVIAVDRSVDLMEGVDSRGHRQPADLTDPAGVDDVFARVLSDHPQIHAVIHTVGMFRGGGIVDSE